MSGTQGARTRRDNGRGTVRALAPGKDGGGRFEVRWTERDAQTGAARQHSRVVRGSRKDAETELERIHATVGTSQAESGNITMAELFERWLARVEANPDRSPSTINGYRSKIRTCFVKPSRAEAAAVQASRRGRVARTSAKPHPWIGHIRVRDLTPEDLERVYIHLRDELELSPRTINGAHAVVRAALGRAVKWRLVDTNVAYLAEERPTVRARKSTIPEVAVYRALVDNAATADQQLLLTLAGELGARQGEFCAIRFSDVIPEENAIRLWRTIVMLRDQKGGWVERATKTHADAVLAIDPDTMKLVVAQMERVRARAAEAGEELVADPYLFCRQHFRQEADIPKDGSVPWTPDYVGQFFRRLRTEIGAPSTVRFHDLRHFMASWLLHLGTPAPIVKERLRHSADSRTLEQFYAHGITGGDQEAAARMAKVVRGDDWTPTPTPAPAVVEPAAEAGDGARVVHLFDRAQHRPAG
jgi:integrase